MILLWLALSLLPGDPERAERAYREGRFEQAYALYEQSLATAPHATGALHFNLGNCAYHLARPALALLHYQRAEWHLGIDAELAWNRRLAEQQLGLPPQPPLREQALVPRGLWCALAAVLQTAGLCGAVLVTRRGARLALLAVALLGAGAGVAALRPPPPAHEAGVVLAPTLDVHAEPAGTDAPRGRLTAGELVFVTAQRDGRIQVRHARVSGWVARDGLGLVP